MRDYIVTITNKYNTIHMSICKNSTIDDTIFQNGCMHRLVKEYHNQVFSGTIESKRISHNA